MAVYDVPTDVLTRVQQKYELQERFYLNKS